MKLSPEPEWGGRFFATQAFGLYKESSAASTLKMRDWKDATDLVVYKRDKK